MHFLTHVSIANMLYKKYSSTFPIAKNHFIYGNIKPDLKSNGLATPHTLQNTIHLTCTMLKELLNDNLDLLTFSVKLGEVCHYLCDYFCYYHINESDYRNYADHFFYEIELHGYWLWKDHVNDLTIFKSGQPTNSSLPLIITKMRKEYDRKSHGFVKDIGYSLGAIDWLFDCLTFNLQYMPRTKQDVYLSNLLKEEEHENSPLHGYL
jgi:hypothetical protein